MPALKGIEEKYYGEYKIDKENADVIYSDEQHIYIDKKTGQKCISVTTLIGLYENEFNAEFWSSYKALESLIPEEKWLILRQVLLTYKRFNEKILNKYQVNKEEFYKKKQEILDSYEATKNEACEHGTSIHAQREEEMYGKGAFNFKSYGFENLCGEFTCTKNHYEFDYDRGVYPEFLISWTSKDGLIRIGGQVDLLVKDGNTFYIADYKTNKEIKKTSYYDKSKKKNVMMKFPLNNLQDVNFYHYTMQLSLYAWMIQQLNPEYQIGGLRIIHIDREDHQTEIEVEYLKEDVERMIKHYYKQVKVQNQLNRCKQIKY